MNGSGPVASPAPLQTVTPGIRYTPVRRPEHRRLAETPETVTNALWTTARCKRLLRPIFSRLALLKKHKPGAHSSESLETDHYRDKRGRDGNKGGFEAMAWTNRSSGLDKRDPEWDPEEGRKKRLKRTYSSKSGSSNTQGHGLPKNSSHLQNPSVQLPSPLVSRRRSVDASRQGGTEDGPRPSRLQATSENSEISAKNRMGYPWSAKANPRDKFRRLAKSIAPLQWMVYDGLYNALDNLLANTAKNKLGSGKGAQSLFSMCLKRLPAYVAEEEARAEEENPDDPEDVMTFMYNELETFSEAKTSMRQVVRAHGILLFSEAIEGGFIAPAIARNLVILCLHYAAYMEAEAIVASLIKAMPPIARPTATVNGLFSQNTSPALQALRDTSLQTRRYKFLFKQLSVLFARGDIPIVWISSHDMIEVWNQALRAVTQSQDDSTEAAELIRTVLKQLYSGHKTDMVNMIHTKRIRSVSLRCKRNIPELLPMPPQCHNEKEESALIATTSNILTIILSVIYAKFFPSNVCDDRNIAASTSLHLLNCLVLESLQAMHFMNPEPWQDGSLPKMATFIYVPTLFIDICSLQKLSSDVDIPEPLSFGKAAPILPNTNTLEILSALLSSIAQCCSRISSTSPFTIIKHITAALQNLPRESTTQPFFSQLAVSTAFEFAEITMRQEHLDWALRVEDTCTNEHDEHGRTPARIASVVKRPENKTTVSFRWEDSICEWVARTPAPTKAKAMAVKVKLVPQTRNQETSRIVDTSGPLEPSSPLGCSSSTFSEIEPDKASTLAPSQTLLSELSPLVVIPKACSSHEDIQDELVDEGHKFKRTALMRFRPRARLIPRRRMEPKYKNMSDLSSDSDSSDETSPHLPLALKCHKLQTLASIPSSPSKGKPTVEVQIPTCSQNIEREAVNRPPSQISHPQPHPTKRSLEVRVSTSQPLSRAAQEEREELRDITNHALAVRKSEPSQSLHRAHRKTMRRKPTDQVSPRAENRVLRPRRHIEKHVRNRIRAGQGRWSLMQASGETSSASRGSFVASSEGEESSEDELGL